MNVECACVWREIFQHSIVRGVGWKHFKQISLNAFDVVAFVMQNRKGVKSLLLRIEDSKRERMARQEKWKFNTFLNPFVCVLVNECVCVRNASNWILLAWNQSANGMKHGSVHRNTFFCIYFSFFFSLIEHCVHVCILYNFVMLFRSLFFSLLSFGGFLYARTRSQAAWKRCIFLARFTCSVCNSLCSTICSCNCN